MDKDKKIFLVRHLKTEFNENGFYMGRVIDLDIKKDKKSLEDFETRIKLVNKNFGPFTKKTKIFSSPLKRCQQTSSLLKNQLKIKDKIIIMHELIETDMGKFSGKNRIQIRQEFGDFVDKWFFEPESFKFPEGESYKNVRQRTRLALKKTKKRLEDINVIFICTHVDIIKMVLSETLGFSFNQRKDLIIPPGSITVLNISEEGTFKVEGVNVYP